LIIQVSDEGITLLRMSELKQQIEMRLPDKALAYKDLKAVAGLLAGPGMSRSSRRKGQAHLTAGLLVK